MNYQKKKNIYIYQYWTCILKITCKSSYAEWIVCWSYTWILDYFALACSNARSRTSSGLRSPAGVKSVIFIKSIWLPTPPDWKQKKTSKIRISYHFPLRWKFYMSLMILNRFGSPCLQIEGLANASSQQLSLGTLLSGFSLSNPKRESKHIGS